MEANEIQEFSNQLKEANEKGESLTHISLAISILAVLVAMVTVLGHRSHTAAVLSQARAGDQWNEYLTKKIRFDQSAIATDLLTLQPSSNAPAVLAKLSEYKAHQDKWSEDLKKELAQAQNFEAEVKVAEATASRYDLGEALLQISVVLCSITLFTRKRTFFYLGLSIGVAGLLIAASALIGK